MIEGYFFDVYVRFLRMYCLRLITKIVHKYFLQFHATLPLFLPPNSGHLDQTLDFTLGLPFDMFFCRRQNICHLSKIPILKAFYRFVATRFV